MAADVGNADQMRAALQDASSRFGPVDILVNNAGQAASAPLHKMDDALWSAMLAVNLTGTYSGMRLVLPSMLERNFGRIVNIASTAGLKGYPYVSAYSAAKHGVIGLTRSVALEVASRNITVNAVCPGYTDTDIVRETVSNIQAKTGRSEGEAMAVLVANNPQRRLIRCEEVANAVAWLCLPGSESVTGQSIAVAGGEIM
ncbi:3-hydroxyacyl-CoA dehydrogenase [Steroidobacter agaridevorans]|nr:3-hydroxyacyl-CoA dehydrogenase [Steroidobacter agaridevorans]